MDNRSSVSSALQQMAQADNTATQQASIDERIAQQQLIIDSAFEANDYSKLAIASQIMQKLQAEQRNAVSAKLSPKLQAEIADALEAYSIELASYVELRCHMSDGMVKAVTLHDIVAPTPKASKAVSAKQSNEAGSKALLAKHGSCVLEKEFNVKEAVFNAGITFAECREIAVKAGDRKNATFQLLLRLRAHNSTCK